MGDLQKTIKNLNNGKAVGPDSIPNELLIHATPKLLGLVLRFRDLNISIGLSSYWCLDLISPIHKAGPKKDPDNYRGICIMDALLKILCTMLNDRLTAYSQSHDLINKEQICFQKKRQDC